MDESILDVGGYANNPERRMIIDNDVLAVKLLAGIPMEGESTRHIVWANEFLRLGVNRTVSSLYYLMSERYNEEQTNDNLPSLHTVRKWSRDFHWNERAETYDIIADTARSREMWQVSQSNLLQAWGRVSKLIRLEETLSEVLDERGPMGDLVNLWVKHKGSKTFNAALVTQYRGILDDIAKETGGRKRETSVEVMFGSPEESLPTLDPSKLSDGELILFTQLIEQAELEVGDLEPGDIEPEIIDIEAEESEQG